jgi:DNA repair protein RecO
MVEKVEGIIVGERSYSESSKILDVFTKEHGVIGVISKGCKKMKSTLRSVSSKLTYGYFNIYYKQDKLSTLTSVDVIDTYKNIKSDITKISYAFFLLELAFNVARESSDESIYNLLISSLGKIEKEFDPALITCVLELKYLNYLGIMPVIDGCTTCGNSNNIATISSTKGGYICNNCLTNENIVSEKTIKLIRLFYLVDLEKLEKLEIGSREKREISEFLDDYYDSYSGLYLKSKKFLKELNRL